MVKHDVAAGTKMENVLTQAMLANVFIDEELLSTKDSMKRDPLLCTNEKLGKTGCKKIMTTPSKNEILEVVNKISAAPYSKTQKPESFAITTLRYILDEDRKKLDKIVHDFSEQDKFPNTDGRIQILNENLVPVCTLEVQIKKIRDRHRKKPRVYCSKSIFGYANLPTLNPVLLIGVDVEQKIAYWIKIDTSLVEQYYNQIQVNKKEILIELPVNNCINGENLDYIQRWEDIYNSHLLKMRNYDELENAFSLLKSHANTILGRQNPDVTVIHQHLDQLNYLLDTKYNIVKKIFYRNSWKLGFAYSKFEANSVTYTHYPIPSNKNDIQIKIIDENLERELNKINHVMVFNSHNNQILRNPYKLAKDFINSKIEIILKNHLLDHQCNQILANEYVIAFIDHFSLQMGLEKKNTYSIAEIEFGFFKYLPVWTKIVYNHIKIPHLFFSEMYHDPESYLVYLPPKERPLIDIQVRKELTESTEFVNNVLGNKRYPFGIFLQMFTYLKSINIKEVSRIYEEKDYQRYRQESCSVFNVYSMEKLKKNLTILLTNIQNVYSSIIKKNFPLLEKELSIFNGATLIIIVYNAPEICPPMGPFPRWTIYYLKSDKFDETVEIKILNLKEFLDDPSYSILESVPKQFQHNGKNYTLFMRTSDVMNAAYSETPLFDLMYSLITDTLKEFLKINENNDFQY